MKVFLKQMGQGIDREALLTILMDESQVAGRKRQRNEEIISINEQNKMEVVDEKI